MKDRELNAIPPCQPDQADDRTARHMRQCAELADLGMQLARAVAARALADHAEPEEPEEPQAAEPLPEPAANAAPAPTRLRPQGAYLRPPTCKPPTCKSMEPALVFTRLAADVRASITLEARLAAGTPTTTARATPVLLHANPRRAPLREALRAVTERRAGGAERLRQATARLDEILAADAAETISDATIFYAICEELDIVIDLATLTDADLDLIPEPPGVPPPDD